MMKNDMRFRQRSYTQRVYSLGFQSNSRALELKMLAVYLRDIRGLKVAERRQFLTDFCHKWYPNYHERADHELVENAIKYSAKEDNVLVEVKSIAINNSEWDWIQQAAQNENEARVLFGLLVIKRLDAEVFRQRNPDKEYKSYKSWAAGTRRFDKLARQLKLKKGVSVYTDVLHELLERELICFAPKGNVLLNYLDSLRSLGASEFSAPRASDSAGASDSVKVSITDFEQLGLYYDYCAGNKRVSLCPVCGTPFTKKANCQKYCTTHRGHDSERVPDGVKTKVCVDCGSEFAVRSKDNKSVRCPKCRKTTAAKQ